LFEHDHLRCDRMAARAEFVDPRRDELGVAMMHLPIMDASNGVLPTCPYLFR
jgi:hypothetical protein